MSPASVTACTSCVQVLKDYQSVVQHQASEELLCPHPAPKQHKRCTKVENGRVVVRSDQMGSES
ncbi:MAG: hypothetical protein MUC48_01925 [Leptolyngbya sp. Prado105]|jgi:hypothetical protein|nr:hypothetical protein [Leptolyngbya sp. Prado105]